MLRAPGCNALLTLEVIKNPEQMRALNIITYEYMNIIDRNRFVLKLNEHGG